ncbi:MAG: hypothetical protein ACR2JJ_08525 [Sphingomicrobium sp.]
MQKSADYAMRFMDGRQWSSREFAFALREFAVADGILTGVIPLHGIRKISTETIWVAPSQHRLFVSFDEQFA